MKVITDHKKGLFPHLKEIKLSCFCPDWAEMCKHVAAVLYAIGARLDHQPEELFLLRQADHAELISKATTTSFTQMTSDQSEQILEHSNLSSLFGIDISDTSNTDMTTLVPNKRLRKKKSASKPRRTVKADKKSKEKKMSRTQTKKIASKNARPIKRKSNKR